MPLDPQQEARVRAEASRRGVDPGKAVAHAESLSSGPSKDSAATGDHPIFDRMLIGALPFVTVREFRSVWLGLTERVPDDEMMCGDFAAKHGGSSASPGTSGPANAGAPA